MLTLYDYLPSQNAWKVRQLLQHLERPYRTQLVSIFEGEGRTPQYRAISPTGTVPSARYIRIALDSASARPSSSTIAGTVPVGLIARYCDVWPSPSKMLTHCVR